MPQRPSAQSSNKSKDDAKYLLAQQHLEKASRRIDEDEEHDETEKSGNMLMKIGIAFVLVLWILTMIWVGKMAFKKKEPGALRDGPTYGRVAFV